MNTNDSVNLTVNKRDKQTAFSTIAKSAIEDSKLTDSALRLLIALLNNVEEWNVSLNYYRNLWGWSKDKMTNATTCLIENGYLIRNIIRNEKGIITRWEYFINECPVPEKQDMDKQQIPVPENQDMDKYDINKHSHPYPGLPDKVEPDMVNQAYNKNNINKNKLNKNNGDGVEVTDISTSEKIEAIETPTPSQDEIERKEKISSNIAIYSHIQSLIVLAFGKGTENAISFKNSFDNNYKKYLNDEIDFNQWEKIKAIFEKEIKFQIQLSDLMKKENVDKYTANNMLLLINTVFANGGTIDCIRGKNKIQRIKQLGHEYKTEWIKVDAEEIVKDPNQQVKFNYA